MILIFDKCHNLRFWCLSAATFSESQEWKQQETLDTSFQSLFYYSSNYEGDNIHHRLQALLSQFTQIWRRRKKYWDTMADKGHHCSLIRSAADTGRCMGNPMLSNSSHSDCVMRAKGLRTHKSLVWLRALVNPIWCPAAPRELSHRLFTWLWKSRAHSITSLKMIWWQVRILKIS